MQMRSVGTAWYLFLPFLDIAKNKIERTTFYKYIKDWCDEIGRTRASIGIVTGARADLYFNDKVSSVSYDSIGELAEKGTDIVFTEKTGPTVLAAYADKYGIAIVNTRGHLTEYGKNLMNAINSAGGHAVILTDYDAEGVKIASESPTEIPWIGVNEKMLKHFKLNRNAVAVSTTSGNKIPYVKHLVENGRHPSGNYVRAGEFDDRFTKDIDVDFLEIQRVEIDAVLASVGEERFFEYIKDTLEELYPKRDYNRVIELNDLLLLLEKPKEEWGEQLEHEKAIIKIDDKIKRFTEEVKEKIREKLKEYDGFTEVNEERKNIKERLGLVLLDDSNYKDFVTKLIDLVNSHPFFTDST